MKILWMIVRGAALFAAGAASVIGVIIWLCWEKVKGGRGGRSD